MMVFARFSTILIFFSVLSACTSQESKLESILDRQIGEARIVEKTRLELDSMLGKGGCELKDSILSYVSDRIEIRYTDIIVDGKKARVRVVAEIPKMDELSALILMAGFLPREQMLDMSVEDIISEISKKTRRPASEAVRNDVYEFSVDFVKEKYWVPNRDQLSNAFAKKNLISQR